MKKGSKHTPEAIEKIRAAKMGQCSGPDNYQWKTEGLGYRSLHNWVEKARPRTGVCTLCGSEGYTENANISGEYRRDLEDFVELCKSCHTLRDGAKCGTQS